MNAPRTRVHCCQDGLVTALRAARTPVGLVVDARLTSYADGIEQELRALAKPVQCRHTVHPPSVDNTDVTRLAEEFGRTAPGCVVAVGGGSVLDTVKLALAAAESPELARWCESGRHRCGLVLLPRRIARRSAQVICIPTTIGTGAEVSAGASVRSGGRKRLIAGPQLIPDAAVLLPDCYHTLPADLRAEGVLEILLRLTGPYVGAEGSVVADAAILHVAASVAELGDRFIGGRADERTALTLSRLSGFAHTPTLQSGRTPFGSTLWYLANEVSGLVDVRKMQATAALLPLFWTMAMTDPRWGSQERLLRVWSAVRPVVDPSLPRAPGPGVAALLRRWGVRTRLPAGPGDAVRLAWAARHAWGGGLPMLAPLTDADLLAFFQALTRAPAPP